MKLKLSRKTAGAFLAVAGVTILMGIITSEALFPGDYSSRSNSLSDLGVSGLNGGHSSRPVAAIFNGTMVVGGLLVLASAGGLYLTAAPFLIVPPVALLGLGITGVGIFPNHTGDIHDYMAAVTFLMGGLAALASSRMAAPPFKYIALLLGFITLVFWSAAEVLVPVFGLGGTERWVAYPSVLWMCGYGGYLMRSGSAGE